MSDLTLTRDHCRRMAAAIHRDDCGTWTGGWVGIGRPRPAVDCSGCATEGERSLWARLAGEIDAYLAGDLLVAGRDDVPLEGM